MLRNPEVIEVTTMFMSKITWWGHYSTTAITESFKCEGGSGEDNIALQVPLIHSLPERVDAYECIGMRVRRITQMFITARQGTRMQWLIDYLHSVQIEYCAVKYSSMAKSVTWPWLNWACSSIPEVKTKGRKNHKQAATYVGCSNGMEMHLSGGQTSGNHWLPEYQLWWN